jgi:prepilin-type N-terminal cleavage/methylation domain-containing protein
MFQRFHAMREEREGGFTLIELLVVILIIAILAAIAIPVFLQQRRKGWVAQAESTLKNAATAQESYATGEGDGSYTDALGTAEPPVGLKGEGFRYAAAEIEFHVDWFDQGNSYCMEADSLNDDGIDMFYLSDTGSPAEGECPAAP